MVRRPEYQIENTKPKPKGKRAGRQRKGIPGGEAYRTQFASMVFVPFFSSSLPEMSQRPHEQGKEIQRLPGHPGQPEEQQRPIVWRTRLIIGFFVSYLFTIYYCYRPLCLPVHFASPQSSRARGPQRHTVSITATPAATCHTKLSTNQKKETSKGGPEGL